MSTATEPTMTRTDRPTPLDDHAQALIDARLDTIERMLLGQVPRADRLAIVRDVEAQLHDLLDGRNPDDTDRDAVIAALSRLDPPEAYLPDDGEIPSRSASPIRAPQQRVAAPRAGQLPQPVIRPGGSLVSGLVGIASLFAVVLALLTLFLAVQANGIDGWAYAFITLRSLVLIASVVALTLATANRLRGAWSVTGFVTGLVSFGCLIVLQILYPIT